MNFDTLFNKIKTGQITKEEARKQFSLSNLAQADHSLIDLNRNIRNGIPEIVYAEYKSYEQVITITDKILETHSLAIISRFPDNETLRKYFSVNHSVYIGEKICVVGELPETRGGILIVSGGAADHPIAEEIELTLRALGVEPLLFEDRGIAHPTRVIEALKTGIEKQVKVVIVVAGMEASLATYVSSLVPLPVIGVPTSVGYGYHTGESALISMLSSCTPNLAVVNTNGGVRAAVIASLIIKSS